MSVCWISTHPKGGISWLLLEHRELVWVWDDTANILLLSVVMCFWPQHWQADWGCCLHLCHRHYIPHDSSCTKQGHLIHIARWWNQDSISKILRYNLMCSSLREEIGPVPDPFLSIALQFSVGECRLVSIQPFSLLWPSIERKRADTVFLSNLRLFFHFVFFKGFHVSTQTESRLSFLILAFLYVLSYEEK